MACKIENGPVRRLKLSKLCVCAWSIAAFTKLSSFLNNKTHIFNDIPSLITMKKGLSVPVTIRSGNACDCKTDIHVIHHGGGH